MTDQALLKTVASRTSVQRDRNQLQRFDWLSKALELFIDEGIDAVRITRLADDLKVTRGSFYWHYRNRDDLVNSLVDYWREKNTAGIVKAVNESQSLEEGILGFFELCIDPELFDPRLDLAIREWSRRSVTIRGEMDRADNRRIQSFTDFFVRFGYSMPDALIRARVIYYSQIGFYALDVTEPLKTRLSYTQAYYQAFTGQSLDPDIASKNTQYLIAKYGDQIP